MVEYKLVDLDYHRAPHRAHITEDCNEEGWRVVGIAMYINDMRDQRIVYALERFVEK